MSENKSCPICNGTFKPADGLTAEEHLAKGIIAIYKELQDKVEYEDCSDSFPCPRCSHVRMNAKVARNALSRHADIQICDICGVDEAALVFSGNPLPLSDWWIVKELLGTKKPEQENASVQENEPTQPSQAKRSSRAKKENAPQQTNKPKRVSKTKRSNRGKSNTKD